MKPNLIGRLVLVFVLGAMVTPADSLGLKNGSLIKGSSWVARTRRSGFRSARRCSGTTSLMWSPLNLNPRREQVRRHQIEAMQIRQLAQLPCRRERGFPCGPSMPLIGEESRRRPVRSFA